MKRSYCTLMLLALLTGCGGAGASAATGGGPRVAREGASSGGMSRRLASEIPPPADGFYPGERAAPAPGSGGFLPVPRAAVPLALNETARGNLEASDPALRTEDAARADDYLFIAPDASDRWVTIDVTGATQDGTSRPLDVYVYLLQGGRVIAQDDDGGGGLNSRIVTQLPAPGMYTLRVSTAGSSLRTGRYTVRVRPGRATSEL